MNEQNYSPPSPLLLSIHHPPRLNGKRLLRHFSLFLGPINNLICCHMIMLRPGVQLPNQLNKYLFFLVAAVNEIYKGQLTTRTRDRWHHTNGSGCSLSTYCAGLRKGQGEIKKRRSCREIYTLKLIHWHNNHKGQLLFCSVSLHSSGRRYGRGRNTRSGHLMVGSHCVSTLLLSTGRTRLDWMIKVVMPI